MSSAAVSVIIPICDMEHEITEILRSAAEELSDLSTEFLIVDRGSSDRSVLAVLQLIKKLGLNGCVVQNGRGSLSSALNAGLYKASGKYVTFLLPHRLYRGVISGYWEMAQKTEADFIFGVVFLSEDKTDSRARLKKYTGSELIMGIIRSSSVVDLGAVLLKRSFLREKQIRFSENCSFGYAEEFIFRALLYTDNIYRVPVLMLRNSVNEITGKSGRLVSSYCFDRVEAMLRIQALIKVQKPEDRRLYDLFTGEKLPDSLLSCVDLLLKEGNGYNAVRGAIRVRKYEPLLKAGRATSVLLRRQLLTWKTIPWMYHSRTEQRER